MRVAAEFIFDEAKVLLRLLGTVSPPSSVQTGRYVVSFFTTRAPLDFDVEADQIVNNEAKIYLSNVNPFPEQLDVTLPDLTIQTVLVNLVKMPPPENLLAEQPVETITPRDPPPHNPSEQVPPPPDEMSPPDYPPFWAEFSFTNANPLRVGTGMASDLISYTGGGAGRILTPTIAQEAADQPPYSVHAPTFLEGAFTNNLQYSDFATTYNPTGFLDPVPTGWTIEQSDPDSLIRVFINPLDLLIPNFQITWYLRPNFQDYTLAPPITIVTPPVAANDTFQVMLEPARSNALGTARLVSATGLFSSSPVVLDGPTFLTLNVQTDPGPVDIEWQQSDGNSAPQYLSVSAPISSTYPTVHTWIPYTTTSNPDLVSVSNLSFAKWKFDSGFIRLESAQEVVQQPLSWVIKFNSTSQVLLQVVGGILASDFSSSVVDLRPLLPTDPSTMGNYKLSWMPSQPFTLLIKSASDQPEQSVSIPFSLNYIIPDPLLTDTLDVSFSAYTPTAGSSRLTYFIFKPGGG